MVPWLLSEQDERKSRNFYYARLGLWGAVCKLRPGRPPPALPGRRSSPEACFTAPSHPRALPARLLPHLFPLNYTSQVEVKAVLSHLGRLLRSPTLSAGNLLAAAEESREGDPRPPACQQLTRRLLLNFLLWAPGGRAMARDVITLVSLPFPASCLSLTAQVEGRLSTQRPGL